MQGYVWAGGCLGVECGTVVRTAMICGGETWALRKEEEGVLLRAERAIW